MEGFDTPERAILTAVNGVVDDLHRSLGIAESEFFCECGRRHCRRRVTLTRAEFARHRAERRPIGVREHLALRVVPGRDPGGELPENVAVLRSARRGRGGSPGPECA